MDRLLVMDRSSANPGVAIFEDGVERFAHTWAGLPTRAPAWMDDLATLLRKWEIAPDSFTRFLCGTGPGSFSGIRACLSALHGMALVDNKPVFGIASAAALALASASEEDSLVTVVGDARRNQFWCVTYRVSPRTNSLILEDDSIPTQTATDFQLADATTLPTVISPDALVVTPDWPRMESVLRPFLTEDQCAKAATPPPPLAPALGRLACSSEERLCLRDPLPIYLHAAVATPPPHS